MEGKLVELTPTYCARFLTNFAWSYNHFCVPLAPKLGEDGVVSEVHPLPEGLLPVEVGLRKQLVVYSCLDASQHYLVVGSLQGYVYVVDLKSMCLLKEFNVS